MTAPMRTKVLIIGTGFAGLGMAIRLKQAGLDDFAVLERAGEVGGTWRDNTYPGAACDVPSHLYSFSFAPNPDWSRSFSPQAEIQEYLERTATDFGVRPHIRFHHEVQGAVWDEADRCWRVRTNHGDFEADVLISATGALSDPAVPALPGLDRFEGTVFHSAQWRHDHDLTGRRVAVVGTGASAIQFVPQIQPQVAHLTVFQRTPPWILPRWDRGSPAGRTVGLPPSARWCSAWPGPASTGAGSRWSAGFVVAPNLMRVAEQLARRHLDRSVPDPELRAKLTPDYRIGCKRILISNDYLPSLTQPNVDLVAAGLTEVRARSVVAADGTEHEVDTIIFGTGFHVTDIPVADRIVGRGGVALKERWADGMKAYKGTAVRRLPQPLPARRAQHRPRPQLAGVHDRVADRLRPRRGAPHRPDGRGRGGPGGVGDGLGRRRADGPWAAPCGRRAAAPAGTSTTGAGTRPSGPAPPGASAATPPASTPTPTA